MDRRTLISCGALAAIFGLWLFQDSQSESAIETTQANRSSEPAQLDLGDVVARPLTPTADEQVMPTAFPFFSREDSKSLLEANDLIAPEKLTPTLATPKKLAIELPSSNAKPAPIEALPTVTAAPTASALATVTNTTTQQITTDNANLVITSEQPKRPPALAAAIARSERLTREALVLADRGAIFSARSRYWLALRQIVIAQDQVNSTTRYSHALHVAQKAIEESHDFDEPPSTVSEPLDLTRIVARHRTEVLHVADLTEMSPATARDKYQLFAVEQLTAAIGGEASASAPLFGLGQISAASGKSNSAGDVFGSDDALVWYHTALMTDATNFRAAHELGSLYAKRGEWDRAKVVLQRAVAIHPHPTTWGNLAVVHAKLGEKDWAIAAQSRSGQPGTQIATNGKVPPIQWVDEATFANSTGPNEVFFPQQAKPPVVARPPADAEPRSAAKPKSAIPWLPWGSTQRR